MCMTAFKLRSSGLLIYAPNAATWYALFLSIYEFQGVHDGD